MKATHPEQCCMFCEEWFVEKDELTQHIRWSHADKRLEEVRLTDNIQTELVTNINDLILADVKYL